MKNRKKLIDTIPFAELMTNGGIFDEIQYLNSIPQDPILPWLTDDLAIQIDKEYYLHHSGDKYVSITYDRLSQAEESGESVDSMLELAKIILNKFADKWNRIYDVLVDEHYNPLENYNMDQSETPNVTKTKNVKSNIQTDNDIYGYNSSASVPTSKSVVHGDSLTNEETETETGTRGLTRSGNIGVTTSQQMLNAEIDLRNNQNFMNIIMDDVDSILCLLVY